MAKVKGLAPYELVGRAAEFDAVMRRVGELASGTPAVVVVSGEAGIGKSRLLIEVERRRPGCLAAGGSAVGRLRPFGLIADALRSDRARPATFHDAVSRALDRGADEFEIAEALVSLVEEAAASEPVLFVLDDLQLSDPSTALTLRHLVHGVPDVPVGVVAAVRAGVPNPHVESFVDDALEQGALHLRLGPLDREGVVDLASTVLARPPGAALAAALARAGGNPFYVIEYLAALDADHALGHRGAAVELVAEPLPESLRETVIRTLRALPPATVGLLEFAAVVGNAFTVADLAAISGRAAGPVYDQLRPALASGVIVDRGSVLAFAHALVEESLYQGVPESVRRVLHHDIGRSLARTADGRERAAFHLVRGARSGDDETADTLLEIADGVVSLETEAELRSAALDVMSSRHPARVDTVRRTIARLGMIGRARDAEALGVRHLSGADDGMARAIHVGLVRALCDASEYPAVLEAARASRLRGGLDAAEESEITACEAIAMVWTGAREDGARLATTLLERADASPLAQVVAQQTLVTTSLLAARTPAAIACGRRALAIERANGTETASGVYLGMALMATDAVHEASAAFKEARRASVARAHASGAVFAELSIAICQLLLGQLEAAALHAESGLAEARVSRNAQGLLAAHAVLARVALHGGDLDRAVAEVRHGEAALATPGPAVDWFLWVRSLVLAETGDAERAVRELTVAWQLLAPWRYLGAYQTIGPDLVRAAMAEGDTATAEAVADEVVFGARMSGGVSASAAATHCAGLVAKDAALLVEAVEQYRRGPRRLATAAAAEDAAALAEPAVGDELLKDARSMFAEAGARHDVARVDAALRARGRRARRSGADRPTHGWDSLTDAERRIVPLVAAGETSKAVAAELYLSVFTVNTHLRRIYQKLGLRSRAQLAAAWAARSATIAS